MKRVIIFDMDGVLFDSVSISTKATLNQYPDMTIEMHKELLCGNFHEELKKINLPRKVQTEKEKTEGKILYSKIKSEIPMYCGAKNLLKELYKKGYILVLNTSAYNRNSLPLLERSGIISLFDFVATAEISKSKIDKFKIIEERYGITKKDVLFITDTLGDIREADIAHIPTVAVTWGAHNEDYFNREPHKNLLKILKTFDELGDFIEVYLG